MYCMVSYTNVHVCIHIAPVTPPAPRCMFKPSSRIYSASDEHVLVCWSGSSHQGGGSGPPPCSRQNTIRSQFSQASSSSATSIPPMRTPMPAPAQKQAKGSSRTKQGGGGASKQQKARYRVLVVEDEPFTRFLTKAVLKVSEQLVGHGSVMVDLACLSGAAAVTFLLLACAGRAWASTPPPCRTVSGP